MIVRLQFRSSFGGVDVAAHPTHVDDLDSLAELRGSLEADLPTEESEVLIWSLAHALGSDDPSFVFSSNFPLPDTFPRS